jgi:hypothetical protein
MAYSQILFATVTALTALSAIGAIGLAVFGDTRYNLGHRGVAMRLAQIALVGATALAALLTST